MNLYHGTSVEALAGILERGIEPRGRDGTRGGHWQGEALSDPRNVYLTSTFGLYFAAVSSGDQPTCAIVEVDVDELDVERLRPDEDALEQLARRTDPTSLPRTLRCPAHVDERGLAARTLWYRGQVAKHARLWSLSLEALGTCSHAGPIPLAAIQRVAVVDVAAAGLSFVARDPTITLEAHGYCGAFYRNLTRRIFGDEATEPDMGPCAFQSFDAGGVQVLEPPADGWRTSALAGMASPNRRGEDPSSSDKDAGDRTDSPSR